MHIKPNFASLRTRLLLLVVGSLLPVLALLLFQGLHNYDLAKVRVIQQAESDAYQVALFSKGVVPEPYDYLRHLATVPEVRPGQPGCGAFLASALQTMSYFDNIFVLRRDGNMTCSGIPLPNSLHLLQANYVELAQRGKAFTLGEFRVGSERSKATLVFTIPILNDAGKVSAILGLAINVSRLAESFAGTLASRPELAGVTTTAVDHFGTVIASTLSHEYIGRSVPEWERIQPNLKNTGRYTAAEHWNDGVVRTTAYLPVFSTGPENLYLRVGVPLTASLTTIWHDTALNFLVIVLILLSAVPAAWCLSHWLVLKPIRVLTQTAALLADGVMSARAGLTKGGGEIGELAVQFDQMAAQLEIQDDALRRVSRVQALRGATNSAMLRAENEPALLNDICQIVKQIGGYQLAWVAYAEYGVPNNVLQLQAHAGANEEMLAALLFAGSSDVDLDVGPLISAARSGTAQVFHELAVAQNAAPWRVAVAEHGFSAAIGLPIWAEHEVIGALGIFSNDPNAFGDEEIQLLTEAVNDVAFGISALRATTEVRRSREFLSEVVNNIPSILFVKEVAELRYVSFNLAGERLLGLREADIVGKTDHDIYPPEQADIFIAQDRRTLAGSHPLWITEDPIVTKTGERRMLQTKKLILMDAEGQPKYLLGISEDITERKKAEERLTYLADYDELTGLPNRHLLMDRLSQTWLRAECDQHALAVLSIDLDDFKEINDTLGQVLGDETLKAVSSWLKDFLRETDTIARVGGDKFIVVLEDITGAGRAAAIAKQIRTRFEKPFTVTGQEIFIGACIGTSRYPDDTEDFETLLRKADIAMYHAKSKGRNTHASYSPRMHAGSKNRLEMRNLLRHAIDRDEMVLHYQPKVSLRTGQLIGAEALIRWHSKELGLVSPVNFIPLAEESGLIVPIGDWVLRTACAQAQQWQNRSVEPFVMAANLSARQLSEVGLLDRIEQILKESGLDARLLEIEVTESTFMDQETNAVDLLNEISNLGIRLAVDDFGTGYSSLAYLKRLPVNVLKIDQSFVKGLTSDENDAAIVTAIIAMAKSLHLTIVAEGVETVEQLAILKNLDCDQYQGYLFSRPLPKNEFEELFSRSI